MISEFLIFASIFDLVLFIQSHSEHHEENNRSEQLHPCLGTNGPESQLDSFVDRCVQPLICSSAEMLVHVLRLPLKYHSFSPLGCSAFEVWSRPSVWSDGSRASVEESWWCKSGMKEGSLKKLQSPSINCWSARSVSACHDLPPPPPPSSPTAIFQ